MEQTKQYEYVDLGLPSGLKWAKCNVGAKTETGYGYCFQWGDIEDKSKSDCSWRTYEHCNGTYNTLTKYCTNSSYGTVDNITTLESVDDAATQIMAVRLITRQSLTLKMTQQLRLWVVIGECRHKMNYKSWRIIRTMSGFATIMAQV